MISKFINLSYKFIKKRTLKIVSDEKLWQIVKAKVALIICFEVIALFLILIAIIFSLSSIVDLVSMRDYGFTANEFINGVRLNAVDSFVQTIKQSFIGNAPSYLYYPFVAFQLMDNYWNTVIFLTLTLLLSLLLALFHIFMQATFLGYRAKKIGIRIVYLHMVLPGAVILILVSAVTIPLNGNSLFSFHVNNEVDWLMPISIVSLPTSTFISNNIWRLYIQWTTSLEKNLFQGMRKRRYRVYLRVFFKLHWSEILTTTLLSLFGLIMIQGLMEYIIKFPGIGAFFVNSLKVDDIWVIEPILCWYIYLLFLITFVLSINRWRTFLSTFWRRAISE